MLGILRQTKEFSSHTILTFTLILTSKIEEKKTWKISESGGYFQILTHDNYEQTNCIQLEFFYAENTAANQRIKYHTLQRS